MLLGYFVAGFWHIADPVGGNLPLPALPESLLGLAGVSTATYLGKKGLRGAWRAHADPAGRQLELTADSDVSVPGGGTIGLKKAGTVTVHAGVTYKLTSAATIGADAAVG